MAMFIRVDVNQDLVRKKAGLAAKLVEVCPVKIFARGLIGLDCGYVLGHGGRKCAALTSGHPPERPLRSQYGPGRAKPPRLR